MNGDSATLGGASAATRPADITGFDPVQRFVRLVPGGNGIIYAIQTDGHLFWYRHADWRGGTNTWSNGGGLRIGTGWQRFSTVLGAADGQLFAVRGNGDVLWYRYVLSDPNSGAGDWAPNSGTVIGTGFQRFGRLFGGFDNVIYGVDDNGSLWWYRYLAGDGTNGAGAWAGSGTGAAIGGGWKYYPYLFADPNGVIFGARQGGDLNWWRYLAGDGGNGAGAWANGGSAVTIGGDWGAGSQKEIISNGGGTIYAVAVDTGQVPGNDDTLLWYRLANSETVPAAVPETSWASGSGGTIGTGFTVERTAALQGYAHARSVDQGQPLDFCASTTFDTYTATVLQLAPGSAAPASVWQSASLAGGIQTLPSDFRTDGCGWQTSFSVPVGANWPSGVYAVRLEGPNGLYQYTGFAVRPTTPTAPIAVLLPTYTYHAYNSWAGHNQYSVGQAKVQRVNSQLRPSTSYDVGTTATISHTLFSDLFLLRWLAANSIGFDSYTDDDLNADGNWLGSYKAIVLCSHPEYWSAAMRATLADYVNNGGRVIYTGGNGLYEEVAVSSDGNVLTFRVPASDPHRPGDRNLFELLDPEHNPARILAVNVNLPAYMDFYPFQVTTMHPLLDGTGLAVGDLFGTAAYNGAASGWEVDNTNVDTPDGAVVIATGQNPKGGAQMTYYENAAGGWVFSASSLSFNGSLPFDQYTPTILRNVLQRATA